MKDVIEILRSVGAIVGPDHFVGTSGRHFDTYVNKDMLFPHTSAVAQVGEMFALKYKDRNIDVVVAPALGGIILSQWTAHSLSKFTGREVLGVYTEKDAAKNQIFTRGYDAFVQGKRILVIEDLATTGGSIEKTVMSVKKAGGIIEAICVMVNKDPELVNSKDLGVPIDSLAEFKVVSYEAANCPLCKKGVLINTHVGHGKKFLEEQKVDKSL